MEKAILRRNPTRRRLTTRHFPLRNFLPKFAYSLAHSEFFAMVEKGLLKIFNRFTIYPNSSLVQRNFPKLQSCCNNRILSHHNIKVRSLFKLSHRLGAGGGVGRKSVVCIRDKLLLEEF